MAKKVVQIRPKMAFSEAKDSNIFAKNFVIFLRFRKIESSKLSENIKKITLNLNFGNREKLVATQKLTQKFEFKFGMQGLRNSIVKIQSIVLYPQTVHNIIGIITIHSEIKEMAM
jgi:hypothetical protein